VYRRRAATLIEMVLVMTLLVVLGALAFPVVESLQANPRLNAAGDVIRSRLAQARSHAIEEGQSYRFAVKDQSGAFRIAPDTPEYWDDSTGSAVARVGQEEADWVVEEALPEKVSFQVKTDQGGSGDWRTVVTFLPDGRASDNAEICYQTHGAQPATLRLQAATGAVSSASLSEPSPSGPVLAAY
jgi:Tfp pilus assembly protein FimT